MPVPAQNHTQTPNIILDYWMPKLGEVQFKVLMAITRKTLGWHKEKDKLSISQLERLTGCARDKICDAVNSLIKKDLIIKETSGKKGSQETYYQLHIQEIPTSSQKLLGVVAKSYPPPSSQKLPTKETPEKERIKETSYRALSSDPEPIQPEPRIDATQGSKKEEPKKVKEWWAASLTDSQYKQVKMSVAKIELFKKSHKEAKDLDIFWKGLTLFDSHSGANPDISILAPWKAIEKHLRELYVPPETDEDDDYSPWD